MVCIGRCLLANYSHYFTLQVNNLVAIELAYVNTKHPDFAEAALIHRKMTEQQLDSVSSLSLSKPKDPEPQSKVCRYLQW